MDTALEQGVYNYGRTETVIYGRDFDVVLSQYVQQRKAKR